MRILAIESSCDDTACAVVEDGRRILSALSASQIAEHRLYGGVVPEIASRRHLESIVPLCEKALEKAGLSLEEIDAVAATYAPGLIGALLVGVNFAKGLAYALEKPLIPVHHIRGHIAANYLAFPELEPPFLCLAVSGGHSHIIEARGYTEFAVIGRTRDDAAGEAFDKAGRAMGLPYPGGVYIDKAARSGNPGAYRLPSPKVDGSPDDFSFSGLKTAVINLIHNTAQKGEAVRENDLAASFQAVVVDMLVGHTLNCALRLGHKKIAVCGGVSANSALRERFSRECSEKNLRLYIPPPELCGDNAAMIGAQAYYEFLAGRIAGLDLNGAASMSVEECRI
ncbi:MAG: tRNA (adenosine(37)-N6)-threonylcarbamoyltransferase complex transferase subunit TsaD [Oscillospiraceae bacterium]|nr:tRNA (adenosine(37)-N6)-threonylcarbamoyltransferase complex transferase subunit TsaD [Oscillospiraceae bacterium]